MLSSGVVLSGDGVVLSGGLVLSRGEGAVWRVLSRGRVVLSGGGGGAVWVCCPGGCGVVHNRK